MLFENMILLILSFTFTTIMGAAQNYYPQRYQPQTYGDPNKNNIPIVAESNELNPDGSFSYSYSTGDGQQQEAQGFLKNAGNKDTEATVIQGSYSYTAPDGTPITVTYIADELGFRAQGAHIPTPPPIPEAILRSLDVIGQGQQSQPQGQASYQSQRYQGSGYKPKYPRTSHY